MYNVMENAKTHHLYAYIKGVNTKKFLFNHKKYELYRYKANLR